MALMLIVRCILFHKNSRWYFMIGSPQSLYMEDDPSLAKPSLNFSAGLAKQQLTFMMNWATGHNALLCLRCGTWSVCDWKRHSILSRFTQFVTQWQRHLILWEPHSCSAVATCTPVGRAWHRARAIMWENIDQTWHKCITLGWKWTRQIGSHNSVELTWSWRVRMSLSLQGNNEMLMGY